ncbi:casein kinase substrate phosphoprotein PP28-domain-containing protein [Multifurca ochricompacta]|uniref:Casein kinase substrate phosphoprotein PP28-domain-containing protein n=1 Tax=Multifurca ochricompacta TaxID=376703 RepID=A0AAD4M234_9AGAM|nr:casein kinase substrate phosphoprotein PP28-domain-containing protein [Multifurca ochricompacta]
MARGSGKFKTKRGGGRSFSRSFSIDENGTAVGEDRRRRNTLEEDSDEDGVSAFARKEIIKRQNGQQATTPKKANKDGDEDGDVDKDDLIANPNRITKKLNISDLSAPRELSRKEREQKEKQEAKDRYWKLHVQGKTDQAKADLSRLAKIRAEREAAASKRKAEAEEKQKALDAKAAQSSKR